MWLLLLLMMMIPGQKKQVLTSQHTAMNTAAYIISNTNIFAIYICICALTSVHVNVHICMYVYIYICMYVCMSLCMYVCMCVCMYVM